MNRAKAGQNEPDTPNRHVSQVVDAQHKMDVG